MKNEINIHFTYLGRNGIYRPFKMPQVTVKEIWKTFFSLIEFYKLKV